MTTVGAVARAALADVSERSAGLANAIRWTNERISDVTVRRMRHRKKVGSIVLPAVITSGLVTLTPGSISVTGDATALLAWTGRDFAGWYLQLASVNTWLRVSVSNDARLELDQPYGGDAVSAVAYRLVQRYVTLEADVAFLPEKMMLDRTRQAVTVKSPSQLDLMFPDRPYNTSGPRYFSSFSEEQGRKILEVYPYSTSDEYLLTTYWEPAPTLGPLDTIPSCITQKDLKTGVLADIYSYQAAKATNEGKVDLANRMSNLAARQETMWEKAKLNISRRDRNVEDTVLMFGTRDGAYRTLNWNARTEVTLRGNRP